MGANNTSKSIRDLLGSMDSGELVLPEIQREFVWSKKSVMLLFDSLYRGLPIGHMLVWRTRQRIRTKKFANSIKTKTKFQDNFYGYLLDGQQRLTAISRVRDGDDEYRLLLNLWLDSQNENGGIVPLFYWWGLWAENEIPWVISVSEVLNDNFSPVEYLKTLRRDIYWKEEFEKPVFDRLTKLQRILEYSVGITEFESETYQEATQLFIRFNNTGKRLSKGDLAMAELAVKVPGLGAEEMESTLRRWAPLFRFSRPFLIQCLAAVHTGRMRLQDPQGVWGDSSPQKIRQSWRETERAISEVIKLLTGVVRWDSITWLPSFNALIPLILVFARGDKLSASDRDLARRWLILSTIRSYFSGSVHTQLDRVLRKLERKPSIKQLWLGTRKRLRKIYPEDFDTGRMTGSVMSFYVSMIRNGGAKDWKDYTPLDGTVLGLNASLQVHHFFPRALLRREGYDSSKIDTFANYTLLSKGTNLDIGIEEPVSYLRREKIRRSELEQQCIPQDESLWRVDQYEKFLKERRKLLASRGNLFLGI
jgi:hypothetical protein